MLSSNDRIEKGILKLQSAARPPLPAGVYTVHAEVGVDTRNQSAIPGSFNEANVSFTITAPRFSIDISLIHSVFPLSGSTGAYDNAMPHIILNRKTLPWERVISKNEGEKRPWLYVLLLSDDELPKDAVKKIELNQVKIAANGTVLPDIELSDDEQNNKNEIKVLEIPFGLFKQVAPLGNELSYLAHTRQVDNTDRFSKDADTDAGWLSVLAGNRLPQYGKTHTAFLVSLEGYGDVIDGKKVADNSSNIRLVLMKQWAFKAEGATFANLLEKLNANAKPLQAEVTEKIGLALSPATRKAFNYGYTIINHEKRNGKNAIAWYRGPLIPVQKAAPYLHSYQSADKALRLDVETGVFDASYAAAWQLGRLLALENPAFFGSISDWKNTYKSQKPILIAQEIITKGPDPMMDPEQLDLAIKEIENDEVLTDLVIELWNKSKP